MESIHGPNNGPIDRTKALEATERARVVLQDEALQRVLSASNGPEIPVPRQIFVNRNLHYSRVELVGFDMDYTLAIYHLRRLEALSYEMTIERLVTAKGYPEAIRKIAYDTSFVMRGLFIDKKHGNLLKIDRFGHVGRAYHGKAALPDETLQALYRNERIRLKNPEYAWIDTLFALPEACLYAGIVDLYEHELQRACDFTTLYDDIREAIDTVHRDNSLKAVIRADLARYIFKDPELGPALHKLRSGGKKLFLLTNSAFDFTRAVMSYLLDGVVPEYPSWKNYFDFVVTDARKPEFFSGHNPFLEIDQSKDDNTVLGEASVLERGRVYKGGNLATFERLTGASGESVLYVGDHIYGDILKSKKTSMWRTCMIVQEIEDEIAYLESRRDEINALSETEALQARLDDEVQRRKVRLNQVERRIEKKDGDQAQLEEEFRVTKAELDRVRKALKECSAVVKIVEQDVEAGFNKYWGLHFKEGNENSRFGEQVEQYACLYTGRVSNFVFYSPMHVFRSPRDEMPHEQAGALSGKMGAMGSEGLPKASLRAPTEIP
ncbi:MAG: HAD-IG family 5'-nucleotidase [Myxococcus sp.]|nr:HAD-IG family 5'-nucleotidase [Myxococcus sp.]